MDNKENAQIALNDIRNLVKFVPSLCTIHKYLKNNGWVNSGNILYDQGVQWAKYQNSKYKIINDGIEEFETISIPEDQIIEYHGNYRGIALGIVNDIARLDGIAKEFVLMNMMNLEYLMENNGK